MIRKSSTYIFALSVLWLASTPVSAQNGAAKCAVRITEPSTGQAVAGRANAGGTATLPSGSHLWTFARRVTTYRTLGVWWPQGEGVVDPATGRWEMPVSIGGIQDVGYQFDVTAAVFDQKEHLILVNYLRRAWKINEYEPIEMPAVVCAANMVTVAKTQE